MHAGYGYVGCERDANPGPLTNTDRLDLTRPAPPQA